jgi:chloramphenicol-sensitive protein RarD
MNAETRAGLFAAMAAYGLWGFLPLYFQFLGDLPPLVILAHRIVWSSSPLANGANSQASSAPRACC